MNIWHTSRFNVLIKAVLCSMLHPLFSEKVLLLTFVGVRSGRLYTVPPVLYLQE